MSVFLLTAKYKIPLNNNMSIEKGQVFEVNLPFGKMPFDSIASKDRVIKALEYRNIDIKGHESYLSGSYFDIKKI